MTMRRALLSSAVATLLLACTEQASTVTPAITQRAELARLVLSDSSAAVGRSVDVYAQVALPAPAVVGSFTARIRYDTTALRLEQELPLDDGALRATNAIAGVVRVAGASGSGFTSGRLAAYRFTVLRVNGALGLDLTMDEMHTMQRTEAASLLRGSAAAGVRP